MPPSIPSAELIVAFGRTGEPIAAPGGAGRCWYVDDLVLKPGVSEEFQAWTAWLHETVAQDGFVLAAPVPTRSGNWTFDGWSAARRIAGRPATELRPPSWKAVAAASEVFHRAVVGIDPPPFLTGRDDPWARADRAAWGEANIDVHPRAAACAERLRAGVEPGGESQLVHGDLTGNVLITADGVPGVIDLSLYWRPAEFAMGVVAADALCWYDATQHMLPEVEVSRAATARGLLFRLLTAAQGDVSDSELARYETAARVIDL